MNPVRVTLALLLATLVAPSFGVAQEETARPPNFLVVLTDDQRYDEVGFLNPVLETPHMDQLARDGVHFRNAFVTTSLCSPSRASLLTGLAMRNHGVLDNNSALPEGLELFPARLQQAGYQTAFIGKWHMGGEDEARPEFDRWVSFPGQGNYEPRSMLGGPSNLNVDGEVVPQRGYITDELTDYAEQFLRGRDAERPFLLYVSHKAVHAPFAPAERHKTQYEGAEIRLGSAAEDPDAAGVPMWVQNQRNSWHGDEFAYHRDLPLADFKREYHRALSAVDDGLGRLRAVIEELGLTEDTVVIFLSDNGFLFGEHGLIDKRNAYEESIRIPMIVAAPGRVPAGRTVDEMVANIDLAPTVLQFSGLDVPGHYDGRSFAGLAMGEEEPAWRRELAYEYYWEFNYPMTPSTFALRTERYKYIQYHGVWDLEELYDLEADPAESRNRIDDPDLLAVKIDLRRRLHAALQPKDGAHAVPYGPRFNQGATFRHRDRSKAAEYPERWLREDSSWDNLEHIVPDGPAKDATVRRLDQVLRPKEESPP